MRTTLDIPDGLFRRAKLAALERRTTLKDLVAKGLEKELGDETGATVRRLTKPLVMLSEDSPLCRNALIDRDLAEEQQEAKALNEVYRRR